MDSLHFSSPSRKPIFAGEIRGEFQSLLLAFPADIISSFVHYLDMAHIGRLLLLGSPPLASTLRRTDVVKALFIQTRTVSLSGPLSLLNTYKNIHTFDLYASYAPCPDWLAWNINSLPPTITRLSLRIDYSFLAFVDPLSTGKFQSSTTASVHQQIRIAALQSSKLLEWIPTRTVLPHLNYLDLGNRSMSVHLYPTWLSTLPETIETLKVNLVPSIEASQPLRLLGSFLPPCLSELSIPTSRYVISELNMDFLPPTLTSLHVGNFTINVAYLMRPELASLKQLVAQRIDVRDDQEQGRHLEIILPRRLELLTLSTTCPRLPICSNRKLTLLLPKNMQYLSLPARQRSPVLSALPQGLKVLRYSSTSLTWTCPFKDLPRSLNELHLPQVIHVQTEDDMKRRENAEEMDKVTQNMAKLTFGESAEATGKSEGEKESFKSVAESRPEDAPEYPDENDLKREAKLVASARFNLFKWKIDQGGEFATTLMSHQLLDLPPRLSVFNASIVLVDSDIRWFPKSITSITISHWILTGYFLSPTIEVVDKYALETSHINLSLSKSMRPIQGVAGPLLHLPDSVRTVDNLDCSHLSTSKLPRDLTKLPRSCPIKDSEGFDSSTLPPNLLRCSAEGPWRFKQWQSIPKSVYLVSNGSVIMEDDDIISAIDMYEKENDWKTKQIASPSNKSKSFSWPNDLALCLEKLITDSLKPYSSPKPAIQDWHAQMKLKLLSRLPRNIEELSVRVLDNLDIPSFLRYKYQENTDKTPSNDGNAENSETGSSSSSCTPFPPGLTKLNLSVSSYASRRQKGTATGSLSTLQLCDFPPSVLPTSLKELLIHGKVYIRELVALGHLSNLERLTIGEIVDEELSGLAAALSLLPRSIRAIKFLGNINIHMSALPSSVEELTIHRKTKLGAHDLRTLPANIKTLKINTTYDLSPYEFEKTPQTLKRLEINGKTFTR